MAELHCVECGHVSVTGEGWKADIADDLREDDPPEVVMFCPECWEREFGTP